MTATLLRLSFAGIRSRVLASILTIMLTGAAAATIILTLEVGEAAADPWMRTFEAAHGAHVLGNLSSEADARILADLPGVTERDEPVAMARATMSVDGQEVEVFLAGLRGPPLINKPVRTGGTEAGDNGVVLERSLSRSLGVPFGTPLEFASARGAVELETVGTAISPAQPRYPRSVPGVAWVTRATLERIEPDRSHWRWLQAVRLSDPASAPTFASAAAAAFPPATVSIQPWQDQREEALREADPFRLVLTTYALLLLLVSVAVVAILIGARVSGQHREIGLLKAIGLTPNQVSMVLVIEATVLSIAGVMLGFVPGALLAPRLAAPAAATLVSSPTVAANPWHILIAGSFILPVTVVSAFASARRNTRSTVLQAIRAGTVIPASQSRLSRMIAASGLSMPIALGLKDLLARRMRAIWLMFAIAVTSAAMVVTLSIQAALADLPEGEPSDVPDGLVALILTLDAVLALMTLSAVISVTLLSVRERVRDFGVMRTIGLTPNQVTSSLAGAHAAIALVASLVSIPAGVGLYLVLYALAGGEGSAVARIAPWWWLAGVPMAMSVATAVATSLPAHLAARIPVAAAVRYE